MEGKVCLVTGSTSGIGLATALELARQGATVILVSHDPEEGEAALAQICDETGSTCVEFLLADLTVQAQVRQLAETVQERYPRLDILVNNAGSFFHQRQESADGIEMTWALNLLAPFLLTNLLLDRLRTSAPARIINVSSILQKVARIHFEDLEGKRRYNRLSAYGQSKLSLLLLTYEFARRLEGTGVTANALDPGFVYSRIIGRNASWPWRGLQAASRLVFSSPEEGARTSIYLASSPEVTEVTGKFFKGAKPVPSSPASYDEAAAQRLWQVCTEMTAETARPDRDATP